ncbi:MAG: STAS domain-containing protein [Thermoanaerobaculia bacterium]
MRFEIKQREADGIQILAPVGQLDTRTSPEFEKVLSQALAAGKTALLLDFGHLDFISSAGLRVLVMIGKRLSAGRGTMALCGMNPSVRKIFDVSGFANLFPIHADAASAVQALAVGARAAQVSGFASDLIGGKEVERPPERGKLGDRADRASLAADLLGGDPPKSGR